MGVRLSIDKHVSNLHELLEMSAQYFQKVRFASKISDDIKQHLKVRDWSKIRSNWAITSFAVNSYIDLEIPGR